MVQLRHSEAPTEHVEQAAEAPTEHVEQAGETAEADEGEQPAGAAQPPGERPVRVELVGEDVVVAAPARLEQQQIVAVRGAVRLQTVTLLPPDHAHLGRGEGDDRGRPA